MNEASLVYVYVIENRRYFVIRREDDTLKTTWIENRPAVRTGWAERPMNLNG